MLNDDYRFGVPSNGHNDATSMPNRTQSIQRKINGRWRNVGYVDIHLHKVKQTPETEVEDISVGITVRINPPRLR